MDFEKWLHKNTCDLKGKLIAVTGTTGGLGQELCRFLCELHADLILLDRNAQKSAKLQKELQIMYPECEISRIKVDLEDMNSVKIAVRTLKNRPLDMFIHNAGAYSIPRHKCSTGYDNVFQINFVSPYYMITELIPHLKIRNGHVVAVGSIAHNYSKTDPQDHDFSTRKASSKVYGNAKRFLMFSLYELFKNETDVTLSIVHPGIAFTNITAHYPKLIFAVIKHPMKVFFMKPKKAALSILRGVFKHTGYHEWIGPRLFDVWGLPKKRTLKTCKPSESQQIGLSAKEIYEKLI
ncbi:MAG: SDR family NAD(P)-dependent oxidoreductase [Clostridia bacterium]|nr:SDR family NAD(P)-dependent oxidoreductase [Clostridia bacterium]